MAVAAERLAGSSRIVVLPERLQTSQREVDQAVSALARARGQRTERMRRFEDLTLAELCARVARG
jgi:hypothetical protein